MLISRRLVQALLAVLLAAVPASANAYTFGITFAYPGSPLAGVPGTVELVDNSFDAADATVSVPTTLNVYRIYQDRPDALAAGLGAPTNDIDLLLGTGQFDLVAQSFDLTGQLIGQVQGFAGAFSDLLGLSFFDPDYGMVVFTHGMLPFRLYADDATAIYDGIGPYTGSADVIYAVLPGSGGIYRIEAAGNVPEAATWAMMIAGFGSIGVVVRRRRVALA